MKIPQYVVVYHASKKTNNALASTRQSRGEFLKSYAPWEVRKLMKGHRVTTRFNHYDMLERVWMRRYG